MIEVQADARADARRPLSTLKRRPATFKDAGKRTASIQGGCFESPFGLVRDRLSDLPTPYLSSGRAEYDDEITGLER